MKLLLALLLTAPAWLSAAHRPNVLFICVDDLKPNAGCYGGVAKTPHIDALAARGVRYERAYCNQAVCAPSRNALMTGFRSTTLGIYDLGTNFRQSRPDAVTIAQTFQKAGYRTEALGKIFHVGHGNHEDPASWSVPHWKSEVVSYLLPENRAKQGLTREEALFSNRGAANLPRGAAYESPDVPDNAYPDGQMTDEAIKRLQAGKERGEPFFLAVGFVKPHLPFCAPKKYWDLYDRASFQIPALRTPPEGAPGFARTTWGELRQYADVPDQGPVSDDMARTLIHGYHAATSYMDAQLGRLLAALDQEGLAGQTVIVFWGDHGWHLGDHGMWSKHTNYEEAAHIPLIVVSPGAKAGAASKSLVETVDIYPTLCELTGVAAPTGLDGKSFAATLRDPSAPTKEYVQHSFPRGERIGRALRTERYRLVEWKNAGAAPDSALLELYDYEVDPAESRNLAEEKGEVTAKLRALLAQEPEAKAQVKGGSEQARPDRAAMFAGRDKDRDGQLTRGEFLLNQPDPDKAPERFTRFDRNQDGVLSREEFIRAGQAK